MPPRTAEGGKRQRSRDRSINIIERIDTMNRSNPRPRTFLMVAAIAVMLVAALPATAGTREGGYVYNHGEDRFVDNVWNFLKHFQTLNLPTYDQYYWAQAYMFTTANNSYVDAMDIAYYSGHGNYWYIGMGPGAILPRGVNIKYAGAWGDSNLEFIIFQSCQVIPSVPEMSAGKISNWWSSWAGPGRVFQGLHQAIGYRTLSYSGNGISDNFGGRVRSGQAVWQAWFAAVNDERSWWRGSDYPGYASVVLYPGRDNDTYYSFGADPPANHYYLRTYYQY
jgi:hypothetical protein